MMSIAERGFAHVFRHIPIEARPWEMMSIAEDGFAPMSWVYGIPFGAGGGRYLPERERVRLVVGVRINGTS